MAEIIAKNLQIKFPIYGSSSRSFKKKFINAATGGILIKSYDEDIFVNALNGVSFNFRDGDRIGLIGHNGSGKSTLLKTVAGIYEPCDGSIEINGSISSLLSLTLGIDSEASGVENIYTRAYLMGLTKCEINNKLEEIIEFSGLGNFIYLPVRTYSSGMLMRLAFSTITSIKSDILIMDEWLSVGDEGFMNKAEIKLNKMLEETKILILASHDKALLKKRCNKIITLSHGRIVE